MSHPNNHLYNQLSPAQQAEYRRRFPRLGFWMGQLPNHPNLAHAQPMQPPHAHVPGPPPAPPPAPPPPHPPDHPFAQAPFNLSPELLAQLHQAGFPPPGMPPPAPGMHAPPPPAVVPPPGRQEPEVTHLDFSLPLNTTVVGAQVSRSILRLPCDIPFGDFWDRVCARMSLDPAQAELGYKFPADRVGDPPQVLATDEDLRRAIETGQGAVRRARTRKVEVIIHNLKPPTETPIAAKKRKADALDAKDLESAISYKNELRALSRHLQCAKHTRHCYLSPIDGQHSSVDQDSLTFWAKKIALKEATLTRPPNLLQFDHTAKRRRATKSTGNGTNIQVVLSDCATLGERSGERRANTEHPARSPLPPPPAVESDDEASDFLVAYPDIRIALDDLHEVMPAANMPQYEAALRSHGIHYVDGVQHVSTDFLLERVGMPQGVIHSFLAHIKRLVKQALKGKGKNVSVGGSRKGENKPIEIE